MIAVLGLLVIFMFRNGRKRQAAMAELQNNVVPGAEVMLQGGIYGHIKSIDDEENRVRVETSPGVILTVHRNAIMNVVTPVAAEATENESLAPDDDPEFGERTSGASNSEFKSPFDASDSNSADADGSASDDSTDSSDKK
nr:preprotein translocase subunit YajC [Lysinibacter cavernae]